MVAWKVVNGRILGKSGPLISVKRMYQQGGHVGEMAETGVLEVGIVSSKAAKQIVIMTTSSIQ